MKEITLRVPEDKVQFVMQLAHELGIEVSNETTISEEHMAIVRDRIRSYSATDTIKWDEARKKLRFDESSQK